MKKLAKIAMALMLVMGMCACTPKPEQPKETIYEVIGTTFADKTTVNEDLRSTLTLYKEGDFELYEYIEGKLSLVRGDYKQRDNEYDLYPQNCKALPEKVVFRATSAEEMILDTDLVISSFGDVFVPEATLPKKETSEYPMIFYSTVKGENDLGTTTLELYEDGTFRLSEVQGMGAVLCEGRYGKEGNVFMFSNFDPFNDMYGNKVYNFEFFEFDNGALMLNEDLNCTAYGTLFTKDGQLPEGYEPYTPEGVELLIKMVHEPIPDVNEMYLPVIEMMNDGTFVMYENVYAGIAQISGHYQILEKTYRFFVEDNTQMQGFMGDDVVLFDIWHDDATGDFRIDRDICMTRANDIFYFYGYGE